MAKLSIVIPCYARHPLSVRHVQECLKSSRLPDEIIVVNDGGTPDLREMLISIGTTIPITYARIEQDILWNYNGAVNLGFWLATGDYVAIEDTDHIPDRELYKKTLATIEQRPEIDRWCYKRKCVDVSELIKPMNEWIQTKTWGPNQMVTIMKRTAYIDLKGQDERFAGNY